MSEVDDVDGANRLSGESWMAAMLAGDFEAAWRESDTLRRRNASDPHRFWDGVDLRDRRVIVRCLHGLGDAVQMLRYAPRLAKLASSVVWEVAPRLVELARCFNGVGEVVTWGDGAPAAAPVWDSQVEVMELPYIFRTTVEDLPIAERYCRLPLAELLRVKASLGVRRRRRVGLVWSGGDWNRSRAIPLAALRPLLEMEECWSLQGGEARSEGFEKGLGLRDATELCGDGLVTLAAAINEMDLVITVDTLAAHLAGALGIPVWVILQKDPDWRWLARGDTCAWYPSMRLFRQTRPGDWSGVVGRICEEMR